MLIEMKKNMQIKANHLTLTQHSLTKYAPHPKTQAAYLSGPCTCFLIFKIDVPFHDLLFPN